MGSAISQTEKSGSVSWEPPVDSTATPPAPLPRLPFCEPPHHGSSTVASPPEPWVARYRGSEVCYLNQRTGALRHGPWIAMQEPKSGMPYAFDPSSGDSRWTPPPRWMEGWIRGAQKAPFDAPTPRERITVAEGCLEIGGGAQWGTGIAPWESFSDLESRVNLHLHTSFPHVQFCDDLVWSAWKGAFIHTFHVCEQMVGGSGVRDHAHVRGYEKLHSLTGQFACTSARVHGDCVRVPSYCCCDARILV